MRVLLGRMFWEGATHDPLGLHGKDSVTVVVCRSDHEPQNKRPFLRVLTHPTGLVLVSFATSYRAFLEVILSLASPLGKEPVGHNAIPRARRIHEEPKRYPGTSLRRRRIEGVHSNAFHSNVNSRKR